VLADVLQKASGRWWLKKAPIGIGIGVGGTNSISSTALGGWGLRSVFTFYCTCNRNCLRLRLISWLI